MRRGRALIQNRFDFSVEELRQLEDELIQNIDKRGLNERERAIAIRIVHDKISTMCKYILAQRHLEAEGDIRCI